jgi:hypothetical protein
VNNGKAPIMGAYVESSEEHETSPRYKSCEVFQQRIGRGWVMSTGSAFCSKHPLVRELRQKGFLGRGT